jgi:Pyruvate/2-oxoacid:ferredoxin oxidoreductase delta subunit/thioredoxin reductase
VGGLLRTGIPAYRLPRAVIDDEIAFILAHGVQVRSGQRVSGAQLVEIRREYDGVVVATGLQERRRMDLDGGAQCVQQALDFLDLSRTRPPDLRGQRVVVAGGGNTAIDAARVALRLGAQDALVVYRRTRAEMPAIAEEIEEALAEGVRIEQLAAPLRLEEAGDAAALVCRRMTLGEPDESGRPRPVPVEGDEGLAEFRCDTVLLALGQAPDGRLLPAGSVLDGEELLPGAEDAPACAAGDLVRTEGTVAAAIGSGRRAAWRLHAALGGVEAPSLPAPLVDASLLTFRDVPHVAMAKGRLRRPSSRRSSFLEVRRGLSDRSGQETAYEEAQRCFSCGACSACGDCVVYCPEGILRHVGTTDCDVDEDYCKGCGLCAAQCPRSALAMLPT